MGQQEFPKANLTRVLPVPVVPLVPTTRRKAFAGASCLNLIIKFFLIDFVRLQFVSKTLLLCIVKTKTAMIDSLFDCYFFPKYFTAESDAIAPSLHAQTIWRKGQWRTSPAAKTPSMFVFISSSV